MKLQKPNTQYHSFIPLLFPVHTITYINLQQFKVTTLFFPIASFVREKQTNKKPSNILSNQILMFRHTNNRQYPFSVLFSGWNSCSCLAALKCVLFTLSSQSSNRSFRLRESGWTCRVTASFRNRFPKLKHVICIQVLRELLVSVSEVCRERRVLVLL